MAVLNLTAPVNQVFEALERHRGGTGINHALSDVLNQIREYHDLPISDGKMEQWTDLEWSRTLPMVISNLVGYQADGRVCVINYTMLRHALKCGQKLPSGTPERTMTDQVTVLLGNYMKE